MGMPSRTRDDTHPDAGVPANANLVLVVTCLAQFMVILDVSIVNLALPRMAAALSMSDGEVQWVLNAYIVAFAGFLLLGGRLADLFGRRRVFLFGLTLFTVASLAGGLAQTALWLLLSRAAQGLGAAVLAPTTLTVLTTSFTTPEARGRAIGIWSATAAAGGAIGALAGGVLTDFLSWRAVLFVNVPLGVVVFFGCLAAITESAPDEKGRSQLDVPGAVLVSASLAALVYGIVATGRSAFVSAGVLVPLVVGVVLFAAFIVVETRAAQPIVPLGFFRNRTLSLANVIELVGGAAMTAMFFFLSLFLQRVAGFRPVTAGLAFLPLSFAIVLGAGVATKNLPKFGPRSLLVAGGLIAAGGLAWLSRTPANAGFLADILGPTILVGVGMGLVMVPITAAATSGIGPDKAGLASGVMNTTRQFGAAIGLAALVAVATARAGNQTHVDRAALAAGYDRGFLIAAVLILVGTAVCLLLPGRPKAEAPPVPAE